MNNELDLKTQVRDFWDEGSCGEIYGTGQSEHDYYTSQSIGRYKLEPYLLDFAKFTEGKGKDVLEIGVGMGADHIEWAKSQPHSLNGIDLTSRAIEHLRKRLKVFGFNSDIHQGDAEDLPYNNESFDLIYSWGVIHHSPNTPKAVSEVFRVLRPSGTARIMIYHKYSLVGYMLWLRYGLLIGHPFRSLSKIYAQHLESPGTKAYTIAQAHAMFKDFSKVSIRTQLSFGDLLMGEVGQQHRGFLLSTAKRLWPRWIFKRIFKNHGLYLLIEASK